MDWRSVKQYISLSILYLNTVSAIVMVEVLKLNSSIINKNLIDDNPVICYMHALFSS